MATSNLGSQQNPDPTVALIRDMSQLMSIPSDDLGNNVAALAPAGVAQVAASLSNLPLGVVAEKEQGEISDDEELMEAAISSSNH